MIHELRRRHRWLAPLSLSAALVGLGAALVVRAPVHAEAGPEPEDSLRGAPTVRSASPHLSVARVGSEEALVVDIVPHEDLAAPDLLAYASRGAGPAGADLPPGAALIGPVSPLHRTRLALPPQHHTLVLYSLGHRARIATLDLAPLVQAEAR